MRTYETIFIVHPDVAGDAYGAVVEKFKGVLTGQGATLLKVDEWGTRKLAYPIKKLQRGNFVLVAYEAGPQVIAEFERRMRIDEAIIKYQTVWLENGLTVEAPAVAVTEGADREDESAGDAGEVGEEGEE
jgi:small subunit ribosomal protein S6